MEDPVAEIAHVIKTLFAAPPDIQREAIECFFAPTASFTGPFCRTGSSEISQWLIIQVYRWYKILSPRIDVEVDSIAFDQDNLILYVSIHQVFNNAVIPFYSAPVGLFAVLQLTTEPQQEPESTETHRCDLVGSTENNGDKKMGQFDKSRMLSTSDCGTDNVGTGIFQRFTSARSNTASILQPSYAEVASKGSDAFKPKYYIQSQKDLYLTTELVKFIAPWGFGVFAFILWQYCATTASVLGALCFDIFTLALSRVIGYDWHRIQQKELNDDRMDEKEGK